MVSQNSARLLTSFFGVPGYGRVLGPANFGLSTDEISYIVEHSGASVLLVDPEVAGTRRKLQQFKIRRPTGKVSTGP